MLAASLSVVAVETVAATPLLGLAAIGLAGVAAVLAIGSALIALGRRPAGERDDLLDPDDDEEVLPAGRP